MSDVEKITPYGAHGDSRGKGEQVRDMFDNIAPAYDLMNRMMTLGIDRSWRKQCVREVMAQRPENILDLATGTGDLAVAMARAGSDCRITGADLSEPMMEVGRSKCQREGFGDRVTFRVADAMKLPFEDNSFDAVTIAFGVRNFENIGNGLKEIERVLKPGGKVVVLELSTPTSLIVRPFYNFYTKAVIPFVGRLVSKDTDAYRYLPQSIAAVPARADMTDLMEKSGFEKARWKNLTLGVACLYSALKPVH